MVKICEVLGCTITEGERVRMYKFPKHNVKQENVWVSWINRPGWIPKSNRVCELHFVPQDYMHIRQDAILRLKSFAILSFQVEERENIEKLCSRKTIQRFQQNSQYIKNVTNIHNIGDKENIDNYIYKDHICNLKALINNKVNKSMLNEII